MLAAEEGAFICTIFACSRVKLTRDMLGADDEDDDDEDVKEVEVVEKLDGKNFIFWYGCPPYSDV